MSKTKTVVTTEEVEIVECSSCGQEIAKEEAHYFMIRNEKNERDFSRRTEGWACKYCVENPISFPVIYRTLGDNTGWFELTAAYLLIFLSVLIIAQILSII
jgi:ribosomal protein L34E